MTYETTARHINDIISTLDAGGWWGHYARQGVLPMRGNTVEIATATKPELCVDDYMVIGV